MSVAPVPGAQIMGSSADRMVGADHAEVRYFTRYMVSFFVSGYFELMSLL